MSKENMERNTKAWLELPAGTTVVVGGHKLTKLASQLNTFGVDEWCVVCQETGVIHHVSRFVDFAKEDPWTDSNGIVTCEELIEACDRLGESCVRSVDHIFDEIEERRSNETQGNLGRQV